MKLNPAKCVSGMASGKFLSFIIHQRGIDVNPEKIRAIIDMKPPQIVKEVQCLVGRLVTIGRFISLASDRSYPILWALKQNKSFSWGLECYQAF
ncbi:hypothetical protein OPV22_009992 [Ensete ventricosum]|uniref:Reverse transcriptase domain-containing protein n=1 Tax=Ensete ventricosum TaxID=4639 RepID=A0AAV8RCD2_ENSVE|nr:hypothetical protein OPV22_009992 [Ensete ventricosum]